MNEPPSREAVLLGEALALPAAERAAYLDEACGTDTDLRRAVQALLDAEEKAGAFLETASSGGRLLAAAANPVLAAAENVVPTQKPGDRIGRYKLLEQIGEGGCGVVFMAEQEEPVRRRVALKIIKLGMDTKSVIARFEAERQALAMMDHPNIAKVLDAGATETGRPYFVMELVRGIKITEYCDQFKLSTHERLKLFISVCQAVQHAHQKGIIHRDLKPSNILVTEHDGAPVPKIIDFGIAKATTDQRLTDKTVFTAFAQFIGTPAYTSPEQAGLGGLDIDTRSDIYSLGVLLYELLTGRPPFSPAEFQRSAIDEILRVIREKEPPRPSTRFTTLSERELTTVAEQRQVESTKLSAVVRGDLDWIVMRCLEKDRTRRYETANGLAADIQRHLNQEPVLACPPSNLYRFQKLVRRNKLAFAAVGAVAAALFIGLGGSTWMFIKEKSARQRAVAAERKAQADERKAQTEAAKSKQIAEFLTEMLKGVGPSVALGRDTTLLREILDKTAGRVGHELTNQPEVEAELGTTIGKVYEALGEYEKSAAMYRKALAIVRTIDGDLPAGAVGRSLTDLGLVLWRQGKLSEAQIIHREALSLNRKTFGDNHPTTAASLNNLALVFRDQNNLSEAESLQREALTMHQRLGGQEDLSLAAYLDNLAMVLMKLGRLAEAEPLSREALAIRTKLQGPGHPTSLSNLGTILERQGKLAEAESVLREALALYEKRLNTREHPDILIALDTLAKVLQRQRKFAEAETLFREALRIQRKLGATKYSDVSHALTRLASVLVGQGKFSESESTLREALILLQKPAAYGQPDESPLLGVVLHHLADSLQKQKHFPEARQLAEEAASLYQRHPEWPTDEREHAFRVLTTVLTDLGDLSAIELSLRRCLAWAREVWTNNPAKLEEYIAQLADVLRREKKYLEAEPLYREALDSALRFASHSSSRLETRISDVATVLEKQGKRRETEQFYRKLVPTGLENDPTNRIIAAARAGAFSRRGQWKEAITHFTAMLELQPTNHNNYRLLAPLLVAAGDVAGYRRLCRQMLDRFHGTTNRAAAATTVKACLILPPAGLELEAFDELAETAIGGQTNADLFIWAEFTKGLTDFRLGRFGSAVEWMEKVSVKRPNPRLGTATHAVLAMAHYRLKHTEQAQTALAKGVETAEKLPKLQDGDLGINWNDWIIAQALLEEAKALIEGAAHTKATTE